MVVSWPGHIKDVGGVRTQFHHMIDIVPTILEVTGIPAPATVDGVAQKPIEGVSMVYTFDQANANAKSKRDTQYFESSQTAASTTTAGMRTTPPEPPWSMGTAKLPDVNDYKWELYNISEDFSQNNDLAARNPEKLKELQTLFLSEAAKYQVLPLDNSILPRLIAPRPSATAGKTVFNYTGPNAGIPVGNAPSLLNKDYTITAEVTIPKAGAEGMIATMGGRFGGYGLYLLKGKPVFVYLLNLKRYRWGGVRGAIG
jgi:arylsulfatase